MEYTRGVDSNRPALRDANRIRVEITMRGRYRLLHSPPAVEEYDRYHRLPHMRREMRRRRWLQDYLASVREEMDRRRLQAQAGIDHRRESLHRPKPGETREEECAVCLQDFEEKDELRMMPCSHSFHQRCIFGWLVIRDNCPVCRSAMSTQDDVLEELLAELHQWIQVIHNYD